MLRSFHPATLACFLLFFFVAAVCAGYAFQIGCVIALLLLNIGGPQSARTWKRIATTIAPIALLLLIVNQLFGTSSRQGAAYALRFVLLILPLVTVIRFVSLDAVAIALRSAPIPARLHYLFFSSLEIVQTLREVFRSVYLAQQLRGFRVERSYLKKWRNVFPLLLPVTLIAVSQSLDRSLSYEFKGIESPAAKTYLRRLTFSYADKIAIALLLTASLLLVCTAWFF